MSKVVAAADQIIEDCVGGRRFSGGSKGVGNTGLWIDITPTRQVLFLSAGNGTDVS